MRLILEEGGDGRLSGQTVAVRVLALNDTYEPVNLDRRLLIGPNPVPGPPFISVEPSSKDEAENLVLLQPWCFYGRERKFDRLSTGRVVFHAYLLIQLEEDLLPDRPRNEAVLGLAAEPLAMEIGTD